MSDLELSALLTLDAEQAGALLMLTHAVDRLVAIRRYGYPKDNAMPEPLHQRMQDPDYVAALLEAADEDEDIATGTRAKLEAHLDALQSQRSAR